MGFGRVQARGQVTIPTEVRQAANIRAGDTLLFEVTGERQLQVVVVPTHSSLDSVFDRYGVPGEFDAGRVWAEVAEDVARDVLGPEADLGRQEVAVGRELARSPAHVGAARGKTPAAKAVDGRAK